VRRHLAPGRVAAIAATRPAPVGRGQQDPGRIAGDQAPGRTPASCRHRRSFPRPLTARSSRSWPAWPARRPSSRAPRCAACCSRPTESPRTVREASARDRSPVTEPATASQPRARSGRRLDLLAGRSLCHPRSPARAAAGERMARRPREVGARADRRPRSRPRAGSWWSTLQAAESARRISRGAGRVVSPLRQCDRCPDHARSSSWAGLCQLARTTLIARVVAALWKVS
jgi:hypothetical protein